MTVMLALTILAPMEDANTSQNLALQHPLAKSHLAQSMDHVYS